MNWADLITLLPTLLGALASSGPWGILAMVLGGGSLYGAVYYFVKRINASTDAADMARAGADAGQTSQDLKKQADSNREWLRKKREEWENERP